MKQTLQIEKAILTRPEGADYLWFPWEEQEQKIQVACKAGWA